MDKGKQMQDQSHQPYLIATAGVNSFPEWHSEVLIVHVRMPLSIDGQWRPFGYTDHPIEPEAKKVVSSRRVHILRIATLVGWTFSQR